MQPPEKRPPVRPAVAAARYVEAIRPYPVVGQEALKLPDPTAALKLDWNESTNGPSPAVLDRVHAFLDERPMHWYPDVASTALTQALAAYTGVPPECVLTFNGSDAALDTVARAYVEPGERVILIAPTYDNFRVFAESCGARVEAFSYADPMDPDFAALDRLPDAKLVYLGSPNNPTGTLYDERVVRGMLERHPRTLFVVDEAYYEFAERSVIRLVTEYPNLVVPRTFSKAFGLAGFRIGYLAAHTTVAAMIARIRVGKSVNALAQVAATAALEHVAYMRRYVADVRTSMGELERGLTDLGFTCFPTPANFMVVRSSDPSGFAEALERELVYIRNLGHLPGMAGCVRITVGSFAVTRELLEVVGRTVGRRAGLRAAA